MAAQHLYTMFLRQSLLLLVKSGFPHEKGCSACHELSRSPAHRSLTEQGRLCWQSCKSGGQAVCHTNCPAGPPNATKGFSLPIIVDIHWDMPCASRFGMIADSYLKTFTSEHRKPSEHTAQAEMGKHQDGSRQAASAVACRCPPCSWLRCSLPLLVPAPAA